MWQWAVRSAGLCCHVMGINPLCAVFMVKLQCNPSPVQGRGAQQTVLSYAASSVSSSNSSCIGSPGVYQGHRSRCGHLGFSGRPDKSRGQFYWLSNKNLHRCRHKQPKSEASVPEVSLGDIYDNWRSCSWAPPRLLTLLKSNDVYGRRWERWACFTRCPMAGLGHYEQCCI